jgi:transcriptional regulator with XRE-family HTH domain
MSMKTWEAKVLQAPGAPERVGVIEDELRLAVGLTALREQAGLSQRALAKLIGISQPRVAAIERSSNVTLAVLEQYARAVGGALEVSIVKGQQKVPLFPAARDQTGPARRSPAKTAAEGVQLRAPRRGTTAEAGRRPPTPAQASKEPTSGRSGEGRKPALATSKRGGPARPARTPK